MEIENLEPRGFCAPACGNQTNCQSIWSKAGVFAVSVLSKIPAIPISLQLFGGPVFAIATGISYCKLETWAGFKIVDATLAKNHNSLHDSANCWSATKKTAILGIAIILGIVSLLPQGFAVAEYNSDFWKIPAGVVTMVAGSFFPIYSIVLSLNTIQCKKANKPKNSNQWEKIRRYMLSVLEKNKKSFINLNKSNKKAFINRHCTDLDKQMHELFSILVSDLQSPPTATKIKNYCSLSISSILGSVLTTCFLTAMTGYTYFQATDQFDSKTLGGITAGLVFGTSAYLIGKSIINTFGRILEEILDIISCTRNRKFAEKISPIMAFSIKFLGLVIDSLAVGPTFVVYGNAFNQNPIEKIVVQSIMCSCVFFLLFTATIDFSEDLVISFWKSRGDEDIKKEIAVYEKYEALYQFLYGSSTQSIVDFLGKLPERKELFNQTNIREEFQELLPVND